MTLIYQQITENGTITLQYSNPLNVQNLQSFLQTPGHKISQCRTKLTIQPILFGGKGAFRQLMRNVGRTTNKSLNQSMARDLTGRRIRDVENEQRLQKWMDGHAERELENEEKRKERLEKLARRANDEYERKKMIDASFDQETEEMLEQMDQALEASKGVDPSKMVQNKRPQRANKGFCCYNTNNDMFSTRDRMMKIDDLADIPFKKKKIGFGLGEEELESDSSDEEKDENEEQEVQTTIDDGIELSQDKTTSSENQSEPEEKEEQNDQLSSKEKHLKAIQDELKQLDQQTNQIKEDDIFQEDFGAYDQNNDEIQYLTGEEVKDINEKELDNEEAKEIAELIENKRKIELEERELAKKREEELAELEATFKPINLKKLKTKEDLKKYHPQHLKKECNRRGLKAGGTDEQRMYRLFFVRSLKWEKIPKKFKNPALL